MARTRVIDADGHVEEPPVLEQFLACMERPHRDRVRASPENPRVLEIDGKPWPGQATPPSVGLMVRGKEPLADWHHKPERSGMWDPHRRIRDMDAEGQDIAVLFPGPWGLAGPGHPDKGMAIAIARAYNNWLAEYCKPDPGRLKGVASLAAWDVQESAAELRRCVKELGFVGGMLPNRPPHTDRNLDDPAYDPLWEEAQRLDVPICIHNNAYQMAMRHRFGTYLQNKPIHDPVENMLAVQCFVFGGALDRFPKLRVAFMEAGVGWVPFWIDRLGEYYEEFLVGKFKRGEPAEYIKSEQCFFSCEVEEHTIAYAVKTIGADRIVYASDYLHHDAKWPGSVACIQERTDLSAKDKAKILGGNAATMYRLEETGRRSR